MNVALGSGRPKVVDSGGLDDQEDLKLAWARADVLRPLLDFKGPKGAMEKRIRSVAADLGVGRATVWRWLDRLRNLDGRASALKELQRGRPTGSSFIAEEVEQIIQEEIKRFWLTPQRPSLSKLVDAIRLRTGAAGYSPPTRRTVQRRIDRLDVVQVRMARGDRRDAKRRTGPPRGRLSPNRPLQIVQVDHTPADVIIVDPSGRETLGRPWLTLAIDVTTRVIVGFHVTLEAPSTTSVALCLTHAVMDKTAWLSEREIDIPWPVSGIPECLHLDNAAEFRGRVLRAGCREWGIKLKYRPVGTPHWGGHIERLIGTMMGAVHLLPGTTFSNVVERGDYDSEGQACMTLGELERWLALEIVGNYHQRIHSSLNCPPITEWEAREADVAGRSPSSFNTFLITFLPTEWRTLRRDGIHLFHIRYWSDLFNQDIGRIKGKLEVRYDPRDLSRVWVRRPAGHFIEARYRNLGWPPAAHWEMEAVNRRLAQQKRAHVNEDVRFATLMEQRRIIDQAAVRKLRARRKKERIPKASKPKKVRMAPEGEAPTETSDGGVIDTSDPNLFTYPTETWDD